MIAVCAFTQKNEFMNEICVNIMMVVDFLLCGDGRGSKGRFQHLVKK